MPRIRAAHISIAAADASTSIRRSRIKRTRYSAEFKARVALEALCGELTTVQLAAKHGIHQTMMGEWKRQAIAVWPRPA